MSPSATGFDRKTKRTRKREFLDAMNLTVPWSEMLELIAPDAAARNAKGGYPLLPMATILSYPHLPEPRNLSLQLLATVNATLTAKGLLLKQGTAIDATLIAAPSSTKNDRGERDPEMHQTKKGNQWHFGMKALQGLPAKSMAVAC